MKKVDKNISRVRLKALIIIQILFLLVLSISFMLMGIVNTDGGNNLLLYISAATFWIGLVGVSVFSILVITVGNRLRKNEERMSSSQFGLIHFFKNKWSSFADLVLIISLVGFIIANLLSVGLAIIFAFLSLLTFSFGMHCILNGINYKYINLKVKEERNHE